MDSLVPASPRRLLGRRPFLRTLAASVGGLVLRPACLQAAARPLPELSFIVVTDTHLGYRDQSAAATLWQKTAAEIEAAPGAFVLHLGDVVDGGREAQYPIYLETRKLIKKPIHEIPGNHDPRELFEKHLRRPIDLSFDHAWLRILMLGNAHTDSHDGFLTPEQIAWMGTQCEEAARRDLRVLICMHVPVHTNKSPDRGWFVKPADGQQELYKLMIKHADRIVALLHGHFHNGIRGWGDHAPVQEILFPSALYNQDRQLEAKGAPGYNLPEFRPGYTLVRLKDGAMELDYRVTGHVENASKTLPIGKVR